MNSEPLRRSRAFSRSVGFGLRALLVLLFAAAGGQSAPAHPAQFTTLQVRVEKDGRFHASLNVDLLAYALRETSATVTDDALAALLDGPREDLALRLAEADDHFRREVVIRTDTGDVPGTDWRLPGLPEIDAATARKILPRTVLPGEIEFSGTLLPAAKTLAIRLPFVLGNTLRVLSLPDGRTEAEPVSAGDYSSAVRLNLPAAGAGPVAAAVPESASSRWRVLGRYVGIGFEHIVPEGLDHILFVLGLFLLSVRWRPLLWQVTAFTLAHSITLALALYGVVRLPASVVEPAIAASIAFVAVENILTPRLRPWRVLVVFGFGLVHGLGFAGALQELGLPRAAFAVGLVGFNVGVECGQLSVIAAAFLTVGWFRHRPWYRRIVVVPASALIAAVALVWTVQRVVSGG